MHFDKFGDTYPFTIPYVSHYNLTLQLRYIMYDIFKPQDIECEMYQENKIMDACNIQYCTTAMTSIV